MTSKWMRSAPAATTASTSSPSRAKSADRIDGAIQQSRIGLRSRLARHSTPQRRAQHQCQRAGDGDGQQRVSVPLQRMARRADDAADDGGADELSHTDAKRQEPLPGAATLLAGFVQRDVAQRRAEQSGHTEAYQRAG